MSLYRCQNGECRVTHFQTDQKPNATCPSCCPACGKLGYSTGR